MDEYKKAIQRLAETKDEFIFKNSSHEHANIVLSTMLDFSNNQFRLYDDNLTGDIADTSPDFYLSLENYLSKGKVIKIVVENIDVKSSNTLQKLFGYMKSHENKIVITKASESFKKHINSIFEKPIYFAVSDTNAFRIEDAPLEGSREAKAFCSFNNAEHSSKLISAFDAEFNSCERLQSN